jgi:hypothetical protein
VRKKRTSRRVGVAQSRRDLLSRTADVCVREIAQRVSAGREERKGGGLNEQVLW